VTATCGTNRLKPATCLKLSDDGQARGFVSVRWSPAPAKEAGQGSGGHIIRSTRWNPPAAQRSLATELWLTSPQSSEIPGE
jgi:hypothetical protein